MPTQLPKPQWPTILGGSLEADWLADRDRKLALILTLSHEVLDVAEYLQASDALFKPDANLLRDNPFAIEWYCSLAGFSLKTLQHMTDGPANFGIKRRVRTIRDALAEGRTVEEGELAGTAAWLKDQIDSAWPAAGRSRDIAISAVSAVLGGRALGQGQNAGGTAAVLLLKTAIVDYAASNGLAVEGRSGPESEWVVDSVEQPASWHPQLRVDGRLLCSFPTGGNTPDVIFRMEGSDVPLAVGEVKGRKDFSNVWESWMPQVVDHMRTWAREYRQSWRLLFGTLFTESMVQGESVRGTERRGLESLHDEGHLDAVYNLAKIASGDAEAVRGFQVLMGALLER